MIKEQSQKLIQILQNKIEQGPDTSKEIALQYLYRLRELVELDKGVIQIVEELQPGGNGNLQNMKRKFTKKYSIQ